LTDPVYQLVEEVFNLNGRGWMRRQATWVAKQLVKMTLDKLIKSQLILTVEGLLSEKQLVENIDWVTELIWPDGKLFQPAPEPTAEEKKAARAAALAGILNVVPTRLRTLVGGEHCDRAIKNSFEFLQMEPLIQHFAYTVLDSLILELFPDLASVIGK